MCINPAPRLVGEDYEICGMVLWSSKAGQLVCQIFLGPTLAVLKREIPIRRIDFVCVFSGLLIIRSEPCGFVLSLSLASVLVLT